MTPKDYQVQSLDWFETFLSRCRQSSDPKAAYEATTFEWRQQRLGYRPLPSMPEVPYVCLRIPTGGGKTMVGGLAIERVNRSFLFTDHSLTLWLVPSEPIRAQTLRKLREPEDLLHQAVFSSLGHVRIMDIDEAVRVHPGELNDSNAIVVSTMQSFKQEDTGRLNVYKQNGDMLPHFEGISDPGVRGNLSFVDMVRMHHPFVVVDEAHNQGTELATETLARMNPSAILELTATPDRRHQPSNVLFSVSASALQAAEMIKLPLELHRRENWHGALLAAYGQLGSLQKAADAERAATREYIRPIMLIQADRSSSVHEAIVPGKVKETLMTDFDVPEAEIAIATGEVDELGEEDVLVENSHRRYIITIDKLKEGWDCPFAYVLCSFRNTSSSVAAEQVIGRIMRMPHATKKGQASLNCAYAYVTSTDFQGTVEALRDGLVRSGFERQETQELLHAVDEPTENDLFSALSSITYESPEMPRAELIPDDLSSMVSVEPESGTVTLGAGLTDRDVSTLEGVFSTEEGRSALRGAVARLRSPRPTRPVSPSDHGEQLRVPLLCLRQEELWEPFDDSHLLQGDWRLVDYPAELSETEFARPDHRTVGGKFYLKDELVKFDYYSEAEAHMRFFDSETAWDQIQLVAWLERNIPDNSVPPDDKAAWLNKGVSWLLTERQLTLQELGYVKLRLRYAFEDRLRKAKASAMRRSFQRLLLDPESFAASGEGGECVFESGRYSWDTLYAGFTSLPKHFFPQIGNLKAQGEEFRCALYLATQLEAVRFWVRNVERKPTSFSLQTSTDRFYPDFVCQLQDGRILVVEYKNSRDFGLDDSKEKRQIGALWERRSQGKGLFIMTKGENFDAIRDKTGFRAQKGTVE